MASFWKTHERIVAGVILALVVLGFIYAPSLRNAENDRIIVPLCQQEGFSHYAYVDLAKQYVGIPDYKIQTYVTPLNENVNVGEQIKFTVRNTNESIANLQKPYFYILVYDSEDKLRAYFPCFCGQTKGAAPIQYDCRKIGDSNYCSFSGNANDKLDAWNGALPWTKNNQQYYCTDKENHFCIADICESRDALFIGTSSDKEFAYSFPADKLGTWKIEVFTYAEDYQKRELGKNSELKQDAYQNSISHTSARIEVVNNHKSTIDSGVIISNTLLVVLTFAGALGLTIPLYDRAKKLIIKNRKQLAIWSIVVLLVILTSLLVNFLLLS